MLCKEENDIIRTLVEHLGWITNQTRPYLTLEVCQLSSILIHSKVDDILKVNNNKLILKAKNEDILLRFELPSQTENFKIVCHNDSSIGNLKDGGS